MTRAEKMAAEISGTSGMRVAPEWLNQPREHKATEKQTRDFLKYIARRASLPGGRQ